MSQTFTPPMAISRVLWMYQWEGERPPFVAVVGSANVDTEEALDMLEAFVKLKRAELARRTCDANSEPLHD